MAKKSKRTATVPEIVTPTIALTPLEELLSGWITKRGEYFVTAFLDSTVMWEEKIDIESVPFISYLVSTLKLDKHYTLKELVRIKAFSFARNTLHSIDICTIKHRLRISEEDKSYTNGSEIVVSGKVLEIAPGEYEDLSGYDVFIGLALHEGCHVLYTDFKENQEFYKSKDLPEGAQLLLHSIINVVEDERIERKLLDRYPGNGNYLARLKEYYFTKFIPKLEPDEFGELPEENLEEFFGLFLQIIRYPKYLDELLVERYIDLLHGIKEILLPFPEEMGECLDACYETFLLIIEYFDLKYEHPEVDDTIKEAVEAVAKDLGSDAPLFGTPPEAPTRDGKSKEEKICDGEYHITDEGLKVLAENGTKESYLKLLNRIKMYIPGFRHFVAYNTYVKKRNLVGLRSGNLDTNKLADGYQGSPTIYQRKVVEVKARLTIALLVDLSGSMYGECMERARDCAVLLTEVFSASKEVDLYVYGYTGQEITARAAELYEYYTPKNRNKYSLVNMKARCQNLDGYSLLQMRNEIRKSTNSEVMAFMISDGEPYGSGYSGKEAIKHLQSAVTTLEKDKFKIIHVAVGYEGLPEVYKNLLTVTDVSNLASDLYRLVKRTLR